MSNKAFTKQNRIDLDDKYYIKSDGASGIEMVFHEMQRREKVVKVDGKMVKTGEMEDFLFEDRWWFTRIAQALQKYADLTQNGGKTIEDILERTARIEDLIKRIDREFKQFE